MSKTCRKCSIAKPLSDFYRHYATADGHAGNCIECVKSQEQLRRRMLLKDPHWVMQERARGREKYHRLYADKHLPQNRAAKRRWVAANPQKRKAHEILNNAIAAKRILKPERCSDCGTSTKVQGHHPDYSKPLAVDWLCSKCHMRRHRKS